MDNELSRDVVALMRDEGMRNYPHESCGLIIEVGKKSIALACPNTHENPEHQFRIASADYLACASQGRIVGVWHTHTNESPEPSDMDRGMCEGTGLPWYIIAVNKGDDGLICEGPVVVSPTGYQMPYLQRPYVYGVHDCHTLLCDYYSREYNIQIRRDRPRIDEWWSKGYNFFEECFEEEGFIDVTGQEPVVGDVFLIQISSPVASHIAIYLGDDTILHHCQGRLSGRHIYGGYWAKHTVRHLRHSTRC